MRLPFRSSDALSVPQANHRTPAGIRPSKVNAGACGTAGGLEGAVKWAEQWDRPIWITVFGCMNESNPDPETVERFFTQALEMFEKHPSIERYAWYPWNLNNHLTEDGELTHLGELFSAASAYREAAGGGASAR